MAARETSYSKLGKCYPKSEVLATDKQYHAELQRMRRCGPNSVCADCGHGPSNWASCNLGIFLCVDCAQIHRGLGTHISKIKSCMGTYLWHDDEMEMMRSHGNDKSNKLYYSRNAGKRPPFADIRAHVMDKYVNLKWKGTQAETAYAAISPASTSPPSSPQRPKAAQKPFLSASGLPEDVAAQWAADWEVQWCH